ncbi:MAG: polymer-forming cytoskeletal protein [Thiotrichaceae bacterium]|nr:polymer-forming cytoskeletal protein [Thiotrichaceae bacterium]
MWGNRRKKKVTQIDSLIGRETVIKGDVQFTGGLHIDGKVKGNILAAEDSGSVLTLSEQGIIEGEVRVPNVILNGKVIGNVYVAENVELAISARIFGNVYYNLIEMAMGAEVNGSLIHSADSSGKPPLPLEHGNQEEKKHTEKTTEETA